LNVFLPATERLRSSRIVISLILEFDVTLPEAILTAPLRASEASLDPRFHQGTVQSCSSEDVLDGRRAGSDVVGSRLSRHELWSSACLLNAASSSTVFERFSASSKAPRRQRVNYLLPEKQVDATHKYSLRQFADVTGVVLDRGRAAWA